MDFSLSNEQRSWQMTARKFAEEEIKPITLDLDEAPDAHGTFDWDIVEKGSKLGFRTMAVPKECGGEGTDFVTQALVMAELARGDSAISKTFSQNWKWSHLISAACNAEQKERFLRPFVADHRFLLGKGITEPTAGSDNRLPPKDAPKAGLKLRAERQGDEWILNGEKCFIANAPVGKLFFIDARTDPNAPLRQGTTMFLVRARHARLPHRQGVQQERLAVLPERRDDLRERPRAARQRGRPRQHLRHEDRGWPATAPAATCSATWSLAANALGVCDDACEQAMKHARTAKQGGQLLFEQQNVQLKINKMNMLTEALRSMVMRVAWEHDHKVHSANAGLAMNYSTDVIQEVTELNLEIHGGAGGKVARHAEKLVRDAFIWSHLAGDTVQRLKVAARLARMAASALMDTKDLAEKGLKLRKELFGDKAVEQRMNAFGAFGEPLQHIINAYAYGDIWSRPGLSLGVKSLAMIAMMAAANRPAELRVHLKGALKNGCTPEEIREVLLLVALYCGIPAANEAHRAAMDVLAEEKKI